MPSTVEAQQNAKNTSDLLRRFRELGERMRQVGGGCGGAARTGAVRGVVAAGGTGAYGGRSTCGQQGEPP